MIQSLGNSFWVQRVDGNYAGYALYRRHYSSKKNHRPKQRQFVGPGEKLVLLGFLCQALFCWRKSRFRKDGQVGVNCSVFRNESKYLSSEMIRDAMSWAWQKWPGERLFTMVNPKEVRSVNPGYCFKKAGWKVCGLSKKLLIILEVYP